MRGKLALEKIFLAVRSVFIVHGLNLARGTSIVNLGSRSYYRETEPSTLSKGKMQFLIYFYY